MRLDLSQFDVDVMAPRQAAIATGEFLEGFDLAGEEGFEDWLRDGGAAGPAKVTELQDFAKAAIAPYKYPRVIEFVAELPKTISGKTQRYRLRQLAAHGSRDAGSPGRG